MSTKSVAPKDLRAVEHGFLIKERRLDLGLNRPAFVAQMERHGQEITPDYLNKLERGTAPLSRASLEVREAIRIVLGYTSEKWQELTGLYVPETGADSESYTSFQTPSVYLAIPRGLQEAINIYGKQFDDLHDPQWQQYLASFSWREGQPEDPNAWLDLYRDLIRAGIVPKNI